MFEVIDAAIKEIHIRQSIHEDDPIFIVRYEIWRLAEEVLKKTNVQVQFDKRIIIIRDTFEKLIIIYNQITKLDDIDQKEMGYSKDDTVLIRLWFISISPDLSERLMSTKTLALQESDIAVEARSRYAKESQELQTIANISGVIHTHDSKKSPRLLTTATELFRRRPRSKSIPILSLGHGNMPKRPLTDSADSVLSTSAPTTSFFGSFFHAMSPRRHSSRPSPPSSPHSSTAEKTDSPRIEN